MMNHRFASISILAGLAMHLIACAESTVDPEPSPSSDAGSLDSGRNRGPDSGSDAPTDSGSDADADCTSAADCPAPTSACVERACKSGVCGQQPKAAGTAVESQTAGDCKRCQCDGAGSVVDVNDDTDLPVDANDCTNDVCTSGVASNPKKATGTACGAGGALKCDTTGTCVGCLLPSDCAGQDTECSTRTCVAGVCGRQNAPLGAVLEKQTAGDCKKAVCDGNGNINSQNDDSDSASDNNACTNDVCVDGALTHPNLANGTSCGANKTCVDGACNGCSVDSDCPAGNECKSPKCTAGLCGFTFTPAGDLATQQPGDCRRARCDGAGNLESLIDNTDVPADDGTQCTVEGCTAGAPTRSNATAGTPCNDNGGTLCNGRGLCVEASCIDGVQNGAETGIDCGGSCAPCAPDVTIVPADGAVAIDVTERIVLTFVSEMAPATLTAQTTAGACTGSLQASSDDFATCIGFTTPVIAAGNMMVTLRPASNLANNRTYKVRVTTDAKKAGGTAVVPYSMPAGFTTKAAPTCASHGYSGALVTFDLTSLSGVSTNAPATTNVAGVSSTVLSRSAALKAESASRALNSSSWATGAAADATRYYTFTVTPAVGCTLALSSLALDVDRSNSRPARADVATNVDGVATHSASFAVAGKPTVSLSASSAGAIEIRIYGYSASAGGGTFRIQNKMTLSGSIQ